LRLTKAARAKNTIASGEAMPAAELVELDGTVLAPDVLLEAEELVLEAVDAVHHVNFCQLGFICGIY
jgi:hypothetical protein